MTTFFKIEERVTPQGHYIVLPETYATFIEADRAMMRYRHPEFMRVREYQTGSGYGPERTPHDNSR